MLNSQRQDCLVNFSDRPGSSTDGLFSSLEGAAGTVQLDELGGNEGTDEEYPVSDLLTRQYCHYNSYFYILKVGEKNFCFVP